MRSLFLLLLLCAAPLAAQDIDLAQRVRDFVAASNRHDVDAMLAATEADFRWIQVVGDRATTEAVGHNDLREWLQSYFVSTPDAHSEVGPVAVHGNFASTIETAHWRRKDGQPAKQTATSVYEFTPAGRIRFVWYFNAQSAPGEEDDAP